MSALERRKRTPNRHNRLWTTVLAAALVCALLTSGAALAAPAEGAVVLPDEAAPKPVVTIQGNVVVDKKKPTGFYELALCVKTARTIVLKADPTQKVDEATYVAALEADPANADDYIVTNYPFQAAAATVRVDLDALTAVTWGTGKPIYSPWTATSGTAGSYANDTAPLSYPRGLDLTNTDQPDIFTDLQPIINGGAVSIRLDTANPDEVTNATALIEDYDAATNTALLTLSANTTTTANVVYPTETPVVVVRFAYDMNRFTNLDVGDPNDSTSPNTSDFWVGLDKSRPDGPVVQQGKTALTYLADRKLDTAGADLYSASDEAAAEASIHQIVWYTQNMRSDEVGQKSTNFYYYLGAETPSTKGTGTYKVIDNGVLVTPDPTLTIPNTAGNVVLANRNEEFKTEVDPEGAGAAYSFFQNLLTMRENTLKLTLVNAETYRKPTGGGGTTILFYDWDDSLIGSLVVDKGDVRAEVNEYVENNLVHPDLRASQYLNNGKVPEAGDATRGAYTNLVDSLEREYTYRGKYPFKVGGNQIQNDPNDPDVLNGEEYPLTNKLDYAFYRRVNRIVEETDVNGAKTNYFSTSSVLDEANLDAGLYPYAYGWAIVENDSKLNREKWQVRRDAEKIENVWTTFGVGELADAKPGVGRTDILIPAAGAGSTQKVLEPAFIAAETAKNPVPAPTNYQYATASTADNRYLRFADFSDIDKELEQYAKENGGYKDTLIVKAVYEPGESLRTGANYQMIEEPYYNKLNSIAAENGAAYSVNVTLERAGIVEGNLIGVSRVRMPAVRQDTTVDQFWVENESFGIDHDLPGATQAIANAKTQTTYTSVNADNGEEVEFQIILSARQQKVDYILVETYGMNVVAGGQRSETNVQQTGAAYITDNYNYRMEDSNSTDNYYDAPYEDRDGSHGFVLYGTLNHMLQNATKYNHNEITQINYNAAVSYAILANANIHDASGKIAQQGNQTTLRTAVKNAAQECEDNHYGDPDYWNNELDCAELTYHQLQWYIIDGNLRSRTAADNEKLSFCHLHATCADLVSNKPKNWDDLVAAATADPDAIDQLSLTEIETMTHLRASTGGGAFGNLMAFKTRFIAAVTAGNTSWVDIQNAMLNGSGSKDTYWWYDGSTANIAPNNLAALGTLAQSALHPQNYPDGTTATTFAKLESVRAIFSQNASADTTGDGIHNVSKVAPGWVRVTNNLVKAHHEDEVGEGDEKETIYTHDKFDDFEEFRTAYLATLTALEDQYYGYGDGMTPPSWETIQYHMLTGKIETVFDPMTPEMIAETAEFWWKDGKTPLRVTSIGTLLKAAQYVNSGTDEEKLLGEAALAKVTLEMLKGDPFYLRATIKGAELDDPTDGYADIAALLTDVKAAQAAGATDWNTLQYYLVHKKIESDKKTMTDEAFYYWWVKGNEGTEIDFSEAVTLDIAIVQLQEAALRGDRFGDPKAKGSVTAQLDNGSFYKLTHLTPTEPTESQTTVGDLSWYTDTDTLLGMVTNMVTFMKTQQGITGEYAMPSVTWHQVQHWILTGQYIEYGTDAYTKAMEDYWWYDNEEKPEPPPPPPERDPQPADGLVAMIVEVLDGTKTEDDLRAVTVDELTSWYVFPSWGNDPPLAEDDGTLDMARDALVALKDAMAGVYDPSDPTTAVLDWSQVACFVATHMDGDPQFLGTGKDAMDYLVYNYGWSSEDDVDWNFGMPIIPRQFDLSEYFG